MSEFLGASSWQGLGVILAAILAIIGIIVATKRREGAAAHKTSEERQAEAPEPMPVIGLKRGRRPPAHKAMEQHEAELPAPPSTVDKAMEQDEGEAAEPVPSIDKILLLPDENELTRLSIDSDFLTQQYEEAHPQATARYHDAKLSTSHIQVWPFNKAGRRVLVSFSFYSQNTDFKATANPREHH